MRAAFIVVSGDFYNERTNERAIIVGQEGFDAWYNWALPVRSEYSEVSEPKHLGACRAQFACERCCNVGICTAIDKWRESSTIGEKAGPQGKGREVRKS